MFGINKEKRFWKWFTKNNSKFLFLNEVEPNIKEQLVAEAPELDNWEFTAFKPAQGTGFVTEFGGRKFDPSKIDFIPLDNHNNPSLVGVRVIFPDFTEQERDVFVGGTYQVIDSIIGERATTLDIDYLDITITPDDISEQPTLKLAELAAYISKKKNAG